MEKYYTKQDLENAYEIGRYQSNIHNIDTFENFEEYFNQLENVGKEMISKELVADILYENGIDDSEIDETIEYYISKNSPKVVEEKIPITYGTIKNTCGWSKWCDVVGGNHYMVWDCGDSNDDYILYCTKSQFQKLF